MKTFNQLKKELNRLDQEAVSCRTEISLSELNLTRYGHTWPEEKQREELDKLNQMKDHLDQIGYDQAAILEALFSPVAQSEPDEAELLDALTAPQPFDAKPNAELKETREKVEAELSHYKEAAEALRQQLNNVCDLIEATEHELEELSEAETVNKPSSEA